MGLSKNEIKTIKAMAQEIKAKVTVGKYGLSSGTLQSIDEVLEADEIAKVKFLSNSIEVDADLCERLAQELQAEFIQKIGKTVVLYREKVETDA